MKAPERPSFRIFIAVLALGAAGAMMQSNEISSATAIVADVGRESILEDGTERDLAELGVVQELFEDWTTGFGFTGRFAGGEEADLSVNFVLQYSLDWIARR